MKKVLLSVGGLLCCLLFTCCGVTPKEQPVKESLTSIRNPFLPGYFADPSLVETEGYYYLYVTSDPWGTDFLACWESDDFVNWTFHTLNWPTKEMCTTPQSGGSMVWAPSVIKKGDSYYMYISVGSEIWCGKASHPLGPWENALGTEPMIPFDSTRYYHVIDAEVFADDDGRYYLYWGSGWNWTNGHCFVAELAEDMCSFKNEPVEVTPSNYFEAPLMVKKDGVYYLTYSDGITMDHTYMVRYAVGDNPMGPFIEAENSPILAVDEEKKVYGPGHHTVAELGGQLYILYHKHRLPFVTGTAYRQSCIDPLYIDTENRIIKNVEPSDQLFIHLPAKEQQTSVVVEKVNASSEQTGAYEGAKFVLDKNYQTIWRPETEDLSPWIELTLSEKQPFSTLMVRFEYPWHMYAFDCQISDDQQEWKTIYQSAGEQMVGSPLNISLAGESFRYVRLSFRDSNVGIWEIAVFE